MSNEIIKQQIPITEIMTIGKAFVESGMFPDIKTAAQAVVKIQAGQEIGIAPFAAMTGIHIIQGRPTIGAGLIASKIKSSGKYDYRVLKHDEKSCSIDIFQGKELIGNSNFTLEDAKKAGTKNMDKHPKNMLFARCISNAVKWFCPDVFSGPVYTPEEMESVTEDTPHEEVKVNGTTLYNHNTLGTAAKPLITNLQFKKLCERVQAGDTKAYYAGLETFTFEAAQKRLVETLFAELIEKEEVPNAV